MSTSETALTAHLVMPGGCPDEDLAAMADELRHRFAISHATIQVEREEGCAQAQDCAG